MEENRDWGMILQFIKKYGERGPVVNRDGRRGILVIENGIDIYVEGTNEKIHYDHDEPLSNIYDDGWDLE